MITFRPYNTYAWRVRAYHKVLAFVTPEDLGAHVWELIVHTTLGGTGVVGEVIVHREDGVKWMIIPRNRLVTVSLAVTPAAVEQAMRDAAQMLNIHLPVPSIGEREAMLEDIGQIVHPGRSGFRAGYQGRPDIHPMGLDPYAQRDWHEGHHDGMQAKHIWEGTPEAVAN